MQDVWNVRLRLPPQQRYAAGDVLVVWPTAEQGLVRRFVVETLERSLAEKVRIRPKSRSEEQNRWRSRLKTGVALRKQALAWP